MLLLVNGAAFGLTMSAANEIVVKNVKVGSTCSFRDSGKGLFYVTNKSSQKIDIYVYPEQPKRSELKYNSRQIPDISWVRVIKSTFSIPPNNSTGTDLHISIPDDAGFAGQKYQFSLISEMIPYPGKGITCALALKTRVILNTLPYKEANLKNRTFKR